DPGVGWSAGNALSLILHDPTVFRTFHSFDGSAADAPRLTVDYATSTPTLNKLIALRFTNLMIPQGTTITDARLSLTSAANSSGPTTWTISAEVPNANGTSD